MREKNGRKQIILQNFASGDLQAETVPMHAQPLHCKEVPLSGENRTREENFENVGEISICKDI